MNCIQCNDKIPRSVKIDGIVRNLHNRTKCLKCSPFGSSRKTTKYSESEFKEYRAKIFRKFYKNKKQQGIDPIKERRLKHKKFIVNLVGGKCQFCPYDRLTRNLVLHHLHDKKFGFNIRGFGLNLPEMLPELMKCVIACHNCHGEIHDGLVSADLVRQRNNEFVEKLEFLKGQNWPDLER